MELSGDTKVKLYPSAELQGVLRDNCRRTTADMIGYNASGDQRNKIAVF